MEKGRIIAVCGDDLFRVWINLAVLHLFLLKNADHEASIISSELLTYNLRGVLRRLLWVI